MAENNRNDQDQVPPSPAQTTPTFRTLGEIDISQMLFELQGSFGEVKGSIAALRNDVSMTNHKMESIDRANSDIRGALNQLLPKIEDVAGFMRHGAPNLASKQDIANLESEIGKRPTRRQTMLDIGWIVALIVGAVTLGSHLAH